MKIEKVILQNIGVYVNKNEFDLRADKPIILIGGMNGRGKTTFLESILFALYGQRSINVSQTLEEYLHKISNVTGKYSDCFIEMQFSVQEQGKRARYVVRRFWNIAQKRIILKTRVSKNGEDNPALSDNWDMFVEEILPRAIASFFFFDGEKIADLAASENDTHIQSSIVSLLGIDIINQLITDLRAVSKSNQKQIKGSHYKVELTVLDEQIEQIQSELANKKQEQEQIQAKLIQLEEKRISIENEYAVIGGDFAESQSKFRQQKQQLQLQMEENHSQLLDFAASDLPLKMVEPLLKSIMKTAETEQDQRELYIFIRQFPHLYAEYSGGKEWGKELKSFFSSLKERIVNIEEVYNLDEDAKVRLAEIPKLLEGELIQVKELINEDQKLKSQCNEIDNYLAVEVEDEQIQVFRQQLVENSYEMGQETTKLNISENQQLELKNHLENLEKTRKQLLLHVVKEQEESDENLRIMTYAQQQIGIMQAYKIQLQALKADELADKMTECFKKIIAKEGLIKKIDIDHETLEFHYFNKYNQQIDHRMLSSGEKQMLVIAMLWALGICSKSEFPLIIDTPLARLDSVHRTSLIENYFPKASEQVIILSTDQEITRQDYLALKKYVDKEYTLIYDEETMSSSIHSGYFGGMKQ